eukprot:3668798-Rhodomonas_salina.2
MQSPSMRAPLRHHGQLHPMAQVQRGKNARSRSPPKPSPSRKGGMASRLHEIYHFVHRQGWLLPPAASRESWAIV